MKIDLILTHINEIPIARHFVKNLPYEYQLKTRAKSLRKAGNLSEVIFWKHVHKGKFWKIDFDRQRIIGNYIVDFYVKALGLIVEDKRILVSYSKWDSEPTIGIFDKNIIDLQMF